MRRRFRATLMAVAVTLAAAPVSVSASASATAVPAHHPRCPVGSHWVRLRRTRSGRVLGGHCRRY